MKRRFGPFGAENKRFWRFAHPKGNKGRKPGKRLPTGEKR